MPAKQMSFIRPVSTSTQWKLIGAGYASALAFAAAAYYQRYLYEASHRAEVAASSGMWAGGDMMLAIFVACLLSIPTAFLVRLVSKNESQAAFCSMVLLAVAVTAPFSLGIVYLGERSVPSGLIAYCLERLLWSPFVLALIGFSRVVSRFDRAKRLIAYALLSEGAALAASILLLVHSLWSKRQ